MGYHTKSSLKTRARFDHHKSGIIHEMKALLDKSKPQKVAVMKSTGTYCPPTMGHVEVMIQGRKMLRGRPSGIAGDKVHVSRPAGLHEYGIVLAFMACNSDDRTKKKMKLKGTPEAFIPESDRLNLIDKAGADEKFDWLQSSLDYHKDIARLQKHYPKHEFVVYDVNGADDVIKHSKWKSSHPQLCAGRPADKGEANGTLDLIKKMSYDMDLDISGYGSYDDGYDLEGWSDEDFIRGLETTDWYSEGNFIILPEAQDISSSMVRKCLQAGDKASLAKMLHPSVLHWMLKWSPYKKHGDHKKHDDHKKPDGHHKKHGDYNRHGHSHHRSSRPHSVQAYMPWFIIGAVIIWFTILGGCGIPLDDGEM